MRTQPKKNITKINNYNIPYGNFVRKQYQNVILKNATVFPKPLEYDDIDNAVFDFVDNEINIVIDGVKVPTYTLYSNQRFSEYSQMWEHSDEYGNLYLNFKTVNRDKNPTFGRNQGSLWNIPGRRKYTLLQREVLDDNGTESYEIYTMKQPYSVDMQYTINFVTTTVENLNQFNQKLNELFSSRQHYIRPNGHFIPMVLDEISDETSYSISDRKFYVQSASIKLMAYVIENDDFEVKKYPKRINISMKGDSFRPKKPCVEIEEIESPLENNTIGLTITFNQYYHTAEFDFDTEMIIKDTKTENIRDYRVMVNDTLYYTGKGFKLHNNDNVMIKIKPIDTEKPSVLRFEGYNPNEFHDPNKIEEKLYDEVPIHEEIKVE